MTQFDAVQSPPAATALGGRRVSQTSGIISSISQPEAQKKSIEAIA